MKSLHKKIGVVAMSSALVMGGAVAGASHMRGNQSLIPVAEAYSNQIKLPFKRPHELKHASPKEIAENDFKIVFGVSDIFNYMIHSVNPGDKPERWVKVHHENFANAMELLGYLSSHSIESGIHQFKIGRQVYRLQFMQDVNYKQWFLFLDQWLNGYKVALADYQLK